MTVGLHPIRRWTSEDIDTRLVFGLYAAVTIVAGLNITGTGIRGLPGVPQAHASLIWIAGMAIAGAGCAAWGLALNDDPVGRRRALYLFATGHLLLGLILWMQWGVYWEGQGLPLPVALAPLAVGVALLGIAAFDSRERVAGGEVPPGTRKLRSTYDEHISQIARREERARLARDLHDAVKQQLFVIHTAAATAQARFDDDAEGAREALAHVRTAAREATTEMEALLEELQAAPMENIGLVEALKKQCEALAFRTGAAVSFEPGALPPAGSLAPGAHEAIYRVAQEALANVARHSRASQIRVSLASGASRFELRVIDNGAGFDAEAIGRGMGTTNMEARAAEMGGRLAITGSPSGTDVTLSVPLVSPVIRAAWSIAALFGLLVLSQAVFYGLRGHAPEQPGLLFLELFGVFVIWRLVAAYRDQRRQGSR